MTLLTLNSTSKYFTCIPSVAAEYMEESQKIIDKLLDFMNVGFGAYI